VKSEYAFSRRGCLRLRRHFSFLGRAARLENIKQRPMLNVSEQIALLKDNGISFTGISEKDAANYLYDKTFLFKLKAFDKNFDKYQDAQDSRFGTYIDLDFAYLVELAELDRNLRFFVIHAALDIEHYLKVHLNKALMDSNVDAYKIVCDFFGVSYFWCHYCIL
jgi:hypothetical protein